MLAASRHGRNEGGRGESSAVTGVAVLKNGSNCFEKRTVRDRHAFRRRAFKRSFY